MKRLRHPATRPGWLPPKGQRLSLVKCGTDNTPWLPCPCDFHRRHRVPRTMATHASAQNQPPSPLVPRPSACRPSRPKPKTQPVYRWRTPSFVPATLVTAVNAGETEEVVVKLPARPSLLGALLGTTKAQHSHGNGSNACECAPSSAHPIVPVGCHV